MEMKSVLANKSLEIGNELTNGNGNSESNARAPEFIERVNANQQKLAAELKPHYDFLNIYRRLWNR
jgi:hypothetical protein